MIWGERPFCQKWSPCSWTVVKISWRERSHRQSDGEQGQRIALRPRRLPVRRLLITLALSTAEYLSFPQKCRSILAPFTSNQAVPFGAPIMTRASRLLLCLAFAAHAQARPVQSYAKLPLSF